MIIMMRGLPIHLDPYLFYFFVSHRIVYTEINKNVFPTCCIHFFKIYMLEFWCRAGATLVVISLIVSFCDGDTGTNEGTQFKSFDIFYFLCKIQTLSLPQGPKNRTHTTYQRPVFSIRENPIRSMHVICSQPI